MTFGKIFLIHKKYKILLIYYNVFRSDLVYRCNDHVPEAIYYELPERIRAEVEIDTTRPPSPT